MQTQQPTADNVTRLLSKYEENAKEIYSLALDRFNRQNSEIDSDDQFILQGKILIDFLNTALKANECNMTAGKLNAEIVYKTNNPTPTSILSEDDIKKAINQQLNEIDPSNDVSDNTVQ